MELQLDIREAQDFSQKELTKILNISQRAYSHSENVTRTTPLDVLVTPADFYGCSTDYLVGRAKEKNETSICIERAWQIYTTAMPVLFPN